MKTWKKVLIAAAAAVVILAVALVVYNVFIYEPARK